MTSQRPYGRQCPRCGGDDFTEKIESTGGKFFTVTVDPSDAGCMASLFLFFSLFGVGFVVLGVVVVTQLAPTAVDTFTVVQDRILGGAAIIFGVLLTVCCIGWAGSAFSAGEDTAIYKYSCRLCHNVWTLRPGDSWPEVHERPNLVAAGKQRLERERIQAEEKRRREEAAKAAQWRTGQDYYYNVVRKRKK